MKYLECISCHKPAILIKDEAVIKNGSKLNADDYMHLDGRDVSANEPMNCDSCGCMLLVYNMRNGKRLYPPKIVHNNLKLQYIKEFRNPYET